MQHLFSVGLVAEVLDGTHVSCEEEGETLSFVGDERVSWTDVSVPVVSMGGGAASEEAGVAEETMDCMAKMGMASA